VRKIKVGIAGLGFAGYNLHAMAYRQIDDAEIHALCTRDKQKLQKVADELNVRNIYTDYEEMLNDEELDAVSICVIDPLHFEYARMALEYNKHVLCEKPLVTTLEEARKLVQIAKKSRVVFGVGHVYRFAPQFTTVKKLVENNRLGTIFHVDTDYIQDMRNVYKTSPWRKEDKRWNSWVAGGSHVVDLARWIGGDIDEVMMYANKGEEDPDCGPVDDNHLSIMKFKNGATCKVWEVRPIKRAPEFTINLNVFGSHGTAMSSFETNEVRYFCLDDGDRQEAFTSIYAEKIGGIPIRYELEDFISSIKNNRSPMTGVIDGAKTIATLLAGLESQKRGVPVKVEDVE